MRKDGSAVWVYINVVALRDERGNPIRATASVIGITARKQAEERLKQALAGERDSDIPRTALAAERHPWLDAQPYV